MKSVTFLQGILPHYRVAFFEQLYEKLRENEINMSLIYGQEKSGTVPESVMVDAPWAQYKRNSHVSISDLDIVFQRIPAEIWRSDLVILQHANRMLTNYGLLMARALGGPKIAYWGHGLNLQSSHARGMREVFKKYLLTKVDWWFAYTKLASRIVADSGFPVQCISTVNNCIDTRDLINEAKVVTDKQLLLIKEELALGTGPIAVYCGGIYKEKRIEFLLKAVVKIRAALPEFELIIIGSGPEAWQIEKAAEKNKWIHYVGPVYGRDRVKYIKLANVMLMPGAVGLAIMDSFALNIPLFTTDVGSHGPEIAYLENSINGIMTRNDDNIFCDTVVRYLMSPEKLQILRNGCKESSEQYTLSNMVNRFAEGISACIHETSTSGD